LPEPEGVVEAKAGVYRFDEFQLDLAHGTLHGRDDTVVEVRPKAPGLFVGALGPIGWI
jgi:hypothetical protein